MHILLIVFVYLLLSFVRQSVETMKAMTGVIKKYLIAYKSQVVFRNPRHHLYPVSSGHNHRYNLAYYAIVHLLF